MIQIATFCLLIAFCCTDVVVAAALQESNLNAYREGARKVLRVHCGACHYPAPVGSNPKVLQIYNLAEVDWAARLSNKQLQNLVSRLRDRSGMTTQELKEVVPRNAPVPARPTKEEIETVQRYATQELLSRVPER